MKDWLKLFLVEFAASVVIFLVSFWVLGCTPPETIIYHPPARPAPAENPRRVGKPGPDPVPAACEDVVIQAPGRVFIGGKAVRQLGPYATGTFDGEDFAPSLYWSTVEDAQRCDPSNDVAEWDNNLMKWSRH